MPGERRSRHRARRDRPNPNLPKLGEPLRPAYLCQWTGPDGACAWRWPRAAHRTSLENRSKCRHLRTFSAAFRGERSKSGCPPYGPTFRRGRKGNARRKPKFDVNTTVHGAGVHFTTNAAQHNKIASVVTG